MPRIYKATGPTKNKAATPGQEKKGKPSVPPKNDNGKKEEGGEN